MIETARLTPGPGFSPINSILYYGMRLLPYAWSRRSVASMAARCIDWLHPGSTVNSNQDSRTPIASILTALQQQGWVCLEPLLSPLQITEIQTFLAEKEVVSGDRSFLASEAPDDVLWAGYSLIDILSCPHVISLMNNAEVLRIARAYLGCSPTISGIGLNWSFPSSGQVVDVQCFHRDPDDWRFFKLFVYLTDVDDHSGPHEFIAGSHRSSGRIFSKPYTEEEVERVYGQKRIIKIVGPKGTTFVADTWGVHRGQVPTTQPRLLLQVQYSILPILKYNYRPVPIPNAELFDRYTNRLLVA
jgi:hypothetical protein